MSKRWHKFNFREWRSDEKLRRCDRDVQAIWLDLCGLIYEAQDMGRLSVEEDGVRRPYTRSELCKLTGDDPRVMNRAISQLVSHKVCEEEGGYLVSRRIAREELKAQLDASNGAKGGKPSLKDKAVAEKGVNPQKPDTRTPDVAALIRAGANEFADIDGSDLDLLEANCRKWANGALAVTAGPLVLAPIIRLLKPAAGGKPCTMDDVRDGITKAAASLHRRGEQVGIAYFEKPILSARDARLKPLPEPENHHERAGQGQSERNGNGRGGDRPRSGGKHGASSFGVAHGWLFGGDQAPTDVPYEPIDGGGERLARSGERR